jgi:hypothetical protein
VGEDWSEVEPLVAGSWRHGCIGAIRGERRDIKARIERVPSSELSVVTNCDPTTSRQQRSAFGSKAGKARMCRFAKLSDEAEAWSLILLNPVCPFPSLCARMHSPSSPS